MDDKEEKMSKLYFYDNNMYISIPDTFVKMTDAEKESFFSNGKFDFAYINHEYNAFITIVLNNIELNKLDVEERIVKYYNMYNRLAPGFIFGEMKIKHGTDSDTALLSFKSNALERDMFNLLTVSNLLNKELVVTFSCNINDSIMFLPQITNMIYEMELNIKNKSNSAIPDLT